MEDLTGRQLGPYRIVAPLGEGGMAAVFKAYQPSMDRYVAVKVLPRHYATDPDFVRRFRQEAKVIAGLEHQNILPVHDYGEAEGYTYLVMRLVEGGTLADRLKAGPLPPATICRVITQLADALDYAHARGVVHRDVKPGNVLLDDRGNCLLTDFGVARLIEASSRLTTSGAFIGTPTYASPEQCLGSTLDGRSDVYSLGVMLYEMVTGRPPFVAETPMAVVVKHIHDPLPPPRTINPAVSEAVERVILKALAKGMEDRYGTAGALAQALAAAAAPPAPAAGPAEPARAPAPPPPTVPRPARARWTPAFAGPTGALILMCACAWIALVAVAAILARNAPLFTAATLTPTPTGQDLPRMPEMAATGASIATAMSSTEPKPTDAAPTPFATAPPAGTATWAVLRSFPAPGAGPSGVARAGDRLWVVVAPERRVYQLDLEGNILAQADLAAPCKSVTWDGASLWCTSMGNSVVQMDPNTGAEAGRFEIDLDTPTGAAWDGTSLWFIDGDAALVRYDREGRLLRRLAISTELGPAAGLTWAGGELWVIDVFRNTSRFDATNFARVDSFQLSDCAAGRFGFEGGLFWDGESLWIAITQENRIVQCGPI